MDAAERIVHLAMFIAGSTEPVTAEQCRGVEGYPTDQDETAFKRMFERDKDELRAAGLVIEIDRSGSSERYHLDPEATFVSSLTFTGEEGVLLRAAGAACLADPAFPYRDDLRFALAKLLPEGGGSWELPVSSACADESPEEQAESVALLTAAVGRRKLARFTYTNLRGVTAEREVEPYGLFAREGRWYLVGLDRDSEEMRVFAVPRIAGLSSDCAAPRSPDFERPEDFDVASWMALPFQWGTTVGHATVRFTGAAAGKAEAITAGRGRIERDDDGSAVWDVSVADFSRLAAWCIQNGPGIEIVGPGEAVDAFRCGLEKVVARHGG